MLALARTRKIPFGSMVDMRPTSFAGPLAMAICEADASAAAAVEKRERLAGDAAQDGPVIEVTGQPDQVRR